MHYISLVRCKIPPPPRWLRACLSSFHYRSLWCPKQALFHPPPPTKPSFNAFDSNQVYETLYDAVGFNVSDDDLSKFPFQASKFTLEVLQKPKIEAFPMTATVVKAVSRDVQQMAYWLVQTGCVKCSGPACFGTMRKMYWIRNFSIFLRLTQPILQDWMSLFLCGKRSVWYWHVFIGRRNIFCILLQKN